MWGVVRDVGWVGGAEWAGLGALRCGLTTHSSTLGTLVNTAPEGTETKLLESLAQLDALCRDDDGHVKKIQQPPYLNDVSLLLGAAKTHNDKIHAKVEAMVVACGGHYQAGPIKLARRVLAKATNDYQGVVAKVIDVVRGSGIFTELLGYSNAIEKLIVGTREAQDDIPRILRFKVRRQ